MSEVAGTSPQEVKYGIIPHNAFKRNGINLYPAGVWEYIDGKKNGVDVMRKDGGSWDMFPNDNMAKYRVDDGFYVLDLDDIKTAEFILPTEIWEKAMKTFRYYTSTKNKMHSVFKRGGDFPYNRYIWTEGAIDSLPAGIIFTGHPSGEFELFDDEMLEISDDEIAIINMAIADAKGDELDEHGNYHWGFENGSMDHVITHKGIEIGTLGSLPFEGTRCDCPFGVSHSDSRGGVGYGFVTASGGVGCNSCEKILYPPPFEKALAEVKTEVVEKADGTQTVREVDPPLVWRDLEREKYVIYHRDVAVYLGKPFFTDQFKHLTGYEGAVPFNSFESRKTVFDPTHPDKFYSDEVGNKFYNEFTPTKAMEMYNYAREHEMTAEVPKYIGLVLDNVFQNEPEVRGLWLHNLAYHLKYFEVGKIINVTIGKAGGEGKGLLYGDLMQMIYGEYFQLVNKDVFLEKHNGHMANCLSLFVDEIATENKIQGEKILTTFKKYASNKTVAVRAMHTGAASVGNFVKINAATNKSTPTAIDSDTDRRFIINETHGGNINTMSWFPDDIEAEFRREIPQLMKHLAGLELSRGEYNKVIDTDTKDDIFFDSLGLREKIALCIKDRDFDKLEEFATEDFAYEKVVNHIEIGRVAINDIADAFGLEGSNVYLIRAFKAQDMTVKSGQVGGVVVKSVLFV